MGRCLKTREVQKAISFSTAIGSSQNRALSELPVLVIAEVTPTDPLVQEKKRIHETREEFEVYEFKTGKRAGTTRREGLGRLDTFATGRSGWIQIAVR